MWTKLTKTGAVVAAFLWAFTGATVPTAFANGTTFNRPETSTTEDKRIKVDMPKAARVALLSRMRSYLETLDDINKALAEEDFAEVARLARDRLGPAHELIAILKKENVPEEKLDMISYLMSRRMESMINSDKYDADYMHNSMHQITKRVLSELPAGVKAKMKAVHEEAETGVTTDPVFGVGHFGHYLPEEMRTLGLQMHVAGAELAALAGSVGDKPSAADYKTVLNALGEVTEQCRNCHATWRLEE